MLTSIPLQKVLEPDFSVSSLYPFAPPPRCHVSPPRQKPLSCLTSTLGPLTRQQVYEVRLRNTWVSLCERGQTSDDWTKTPVVTPPSHVYYTLLWNLLRVGRTSCTGDFVASEGFCLLHLITLRSIPLTTTYFEQGGLRANKVTRGWHTNTLRLCAHQGRESNYPSPPCQYFDEISVKEFDPHCLHRWTFSNS